MKKSDLKTGMRVKMRDGGIYIVLKDCETGRGHQDMIFCNTDGWMHGSGYTDKLIYMGDERWDIVKVYQSNANNHYCCGHTLDFSKPYRCIWTRYDENLSKKLDDLKFVIERVTADIEEMRKQIC